MLIKNFMPENKRHPAEYLSKAWIKRHMIVFARLSEIDQTLLVLQLAIEVSTATMRGMVASPRETKYIPIGDDSLRRKAGVEKLGI